MQILNVQKNQKKKKNNVQNTLYVYFLNINLLS